MKEITLRSGQEVERSLQAEKVTKEVPIEREDKEQSKEKDVAEKPPFKPTISYSARLKNTQTNEQYKKFLDLFKKLHFNIPFVEALSQIPHYVKFLKNLLTNKRKLESVVVFLHASCSTYFRKSSKEDERS